MIPSEADARVSAAYERGVRDAVWPEGPNGDAMRSIAAERDALRVEKEQLSADLKPLHEAMDSSKYLVEAWGKNVCEYAARELVELRADNERLMAEVEAWRDADKNYGCPVGDSKNSLEASRMALARAYSERLAKARKLRDENRAALAAPTSEHE